MRGEGAVIRTISIVTRWPISWVFGGIQAAAVPQKSTKPKEALNIPLGVILSAFSGSGHGFLSEYADRVLSTHESGERGLGLPALGFVCCSEEES